MPEPCARRGASGRPMPSLPLRFPQGPSPGMASSYIAPVRWLLVPLSVMTFACEAPAQEPRSPEPDGRLMWSAFVCATYAMMSENRDEQERLFSLGYEAGTRFLEAWPSLSEEQRLNQPTVVLLHLAGPSDDFRLGRIYQAAEDHAHDQVVRTDERGVPVLDDEAEAFRAQSLFRRENCSLLR